MSKISNLFTGILPGKNKDNGYYLELKEDETKATESNGVKPVQPVTETSVTPDASASNGKTAEKEETNSKSKKVSIKERRKAEKAKKPQSATLPQATSTAPTKTVKPQEPVETNFATKYLIQTSTNARRRPGPNMNSFLEMARTVKTPIIK